MTAILAHVRTKPGMAARFEEIERDLARQTHAGEADCLRYECWRGAEPDTYKVLLFFTSIEAFYEHQTSDWHEHYLEPMNACFEDVVLELLDPVAGIDPAIPPTRGELPADANPRAREYEAMYPLTTPSWWQALRAGAKTEA